MQAVSLNGCALEFAAEELKGDRKIVMAALSGFVQHLWTWIQITWRETALSWRGPTKVKDLRELEPGKLHEITLVLS